MFSAFIEIGNSVANVFLVILPFVVLVYLILKFVRADY